jgi:acetyltransferase-like isoleucine patch superfamily enzyme
MLEVYVELMEEVPPREVDPGRSIVARIVPRIRYGLVRSVRATVVLIFYRRSRGDKSLLGLPTGLLLTNGFFQRVLRLNGRASFPVHFTSRVTNPSAITLGTGVARYLAVSGGCYVQAANGVHIGDNTMIAPGVKIISANHGQDDRNNHDAASPIIIGANCWLGANVTVLPGVSIGEGTIVGAGSVVTQNLPSNCVAVGVPARPRAVSDTDNATGESAN